MSEILKIDQNNPLYPKNLLKSTVPERKPPSLYATGSFSNTEKTAFLATIGSREIIQEHMQVVADFLHAFFTAFGQKYPTAILSIVSGMAIGGDSVGHQMALAHGIETIGVSATSINHLQQWGNQEVFEELQKPDTKGAIISEYPAADTPIEPNYLARNRIVAWMSGSVLVYGVYEVRSGAMSTVSLARNIGIPVYFIEGTVYRAPRNALLKRGAIEVASVDDFMKKIATK